jgi:hypothetical protein
VVIPALLSNLLIRSIYIGCVFQNPSSSGSVLSAESIHSLPLTLSSSDSSVPLGRNVAPTHWNIRYCPELQKNPTPRHDGHYASRISFPLGQFGLCIVYSRASDGGTSRISSRVHRLLLHLQLRSAETCGDPLNSVPYYRTYSSSVVDHAYTADVPALNGAIVPGGYPVQGVTGLVFITQEVSTVQFYRLYSAAATDHFFTMSTTERDNALRANRTSSPIGTQASSRPLRRGSSPLLPQYLLPATGEGERLRRIEEEPEHEAANTHVHELQRLAGMWHSLGQLT